MPSPIILLHLPALSGSALVVLPGGGRLLGRSSKSDLIVNHPSVSRRHALVAVDGVGLRVTELGSKNGTFIDDIRVSGTEVAPLGSRVRFGCLSYLITGREAVVRELDSGQETERPMPGQTGSARAESERLSAAEWRVFRLLVEGLPEKRIASRLRISPCTVHNHIGAIYRAFGVHSRAELLVHVLSGKATT